MKTPLASLMALTLLLGACSTARDVPGGDVSEMDLRTAVTGTFEARCVRCHGRSDPAGGLSLGGDDPERSLVNAWSYADDRYLLVSPGEPEQSFLIKVLRGEAGIRGSHAPGGSAPLSDAEVDLVERWIASLPRSDRK